MHNAGEAMLSKKNRKVVSLPELEQHVINWVIDKLDAIRDETYQIETDQILTEDRKTSLCAGRARSVDELLSLIGPLRHDSECLIEWAFNFVDEYRQWNRSHAKNSE
jgi:hypothetical protein